jgi:hypothetical protein
VDNPSDAGLEGGSGDVHFDMQLTTGHLDGSTAGLVNTGNLLVHLTMQ